mgnify:FL=1
MINVAFLMDPLDSLNLKKDSTLAMIKEAQLRKYNVYYFTLDDLVIRQGAPYAKFAKLRLKEDFLENLDGQSSSAANWYELADPEEQPLEMMQVIMMRKDPPFDMEYIYSTYYLERAEAKGSLVINKPSSLRDCNEKLFATHFPQLTPELVVSRNSQTLKEFFFQHEDVVFKKLDGMGGKSIFRVKGDDSNLNVIIETLTDNSSTQIMAQKYIPEIAEGDKRILMIDGEPLPWVLARIPATGESRGNLAAGGTGVGQPISQRDQEIAKQLGPELRKRGLIFVGIDVIGDYLTEINVTCPTCIRELDQQFDSNISADLMNCIENKLS